MGEIIKSFLVGLNFDVNDGDLSKFNNAIAGASKKVIALAASVKVAAASIVYGIAKVSEGFEQMGYDMRLIAPSINKILILRREMLRAYSAAGVNLVRVIQNSIRLNISLTKTRYAFEAIYRSVAAKFFPLLTKQSDLFRDKLYKNMPKIQAFLEKAITFVFKAFDSVVILGTRLWSILGRVFDFFVKLDQATDGWSTKILLAVAAWKLLNLTFLASPFGLVITGLTTLLSLYDDLQTFKEGGKSLFNWSSVIPIIDKVSYALSKVAEVLGSILQIQWAISDAFLDLFTLNFSGALDKLGIAKDVVSEMFKNVFGGNYTPTQGPILGPLKNPISSQVQNSNTNQNIQQQTSINIHSSADAASVGKSIAGEQSKVHFDMVRNLKGATR